MALVGATSWFIRWPFIIEGFLKDCSSLVAFFVLSKAYQYFINQVKEIIPLYQWGWNEFIIKLVYYCAFMVLQSDFWQHALP